MTPEEARALEHGTTPGPWTASECTGFIAAAEGERPVLTAERGDWWCEEDHRLATAAPDMRATIAALRWEYAVEVRPDEDSEWQNTAPWWDTIEKARAWRGRAVIRIGQPYHHNRIVRRMVAPVEVVEE